MERGELKKKFLQTGFRPDKRLGQNFLIDGNIRNKILAALSVTRDTPVLEIGPGFGMMTGALAGMARKVYAVEKDSELCRLVESSFAEKGNIELICSDILKVDIEEISNKEGKKLLVYGNIPYNITAPIIEKAINAKKAVRELCVVMQDEVASRLCAFPGTKIYGSLTCFVQYHARVSRLFRISKNCFFPKPKVGSCFVRLEFLDMPSVEVEDEEMMFAIIRKAFSQRRKKILNPLSDDGFMGICRDSWSGILNAAGIDPGLRAEDISLKEYAGISDEAGRAVKEPLRRGLTLRSGGL